MSALALIARIVLFAAAFATYKVTGRTADIGYRAMRRLTGATDSGLNLWSLKIARWLRPEPPRRAVQGFLGEFSVADIERVVAQLDRDGIAILDRRLPEPMCAALEALARSTPALPLGRQEKELYRAETASALLYDISEPDILGSAEACRICFDGTLAAISAAYFRCLPLYDFVDLWWTTGKGP